jgi:hypothetical protein
MIRIIILFLAVIFLFADPVTADDPSTDAMATFGLFGVWGRDCASPTSSSYEYIHKSTGENLYVLFNNAERKNAMESRIESAQLVPPNRIGLVVRTPVNSQFRLILQKEDNKLRLMESGDVRSKDVRVHNGISTADGNATASFERCGQ